MKRLFVFFTCMLSMALILGIHQPASARTAPNILVIWGDDIGQFNVSAYNMGVMGYKTPNIDRLANEGMRFTDAYSACPVCAPARSCLMTGTHMGHTSVRLNTGGAPLLAKDVQLFATGS